MLKDITLGQYFPGKSPIHLLDPRTKLILLVVYIVALFMAGGWISYALLFAALAVVIKVSTIPIRISSLSNKSFYRVNHNTHGTGIQSQNAHFVEKVRAR